MPRPLVVLPTYQEAANIGVIIPAIRAVLPDAVVLVVDDGSPDGTADLAAAAGAEVLRRRPPRGLGPAYRDGFAWALSGGFDPVFQMDADFSHAPADLLRLSAALSPGLSPGAGGDPGTPAGLAIGSRYVPGGGTRNWSRSRQALSRFGGFYARLCLGLPVSDPTGGFKCWRADTLRAIQPETLRADGYTFQVEATWRAWKIGATIREIPIWFNDRERGNSKMSPSIALEAAWAVPMLRLR